MAEARLVGKSISPACPECGDRYCLVSRSGGDDAGLSIRERHCQNCDTQFPTVEVVVPGTTFQRLDVERATYQMLWLRDKRGYKGQRPRKKKITDRIHRIRIEVRNHGYLIDD